VVASGVHIDLLFTDVVMPGALRSPEMARKAVQMLPGLKVLFTSGYTQNAIVHGGRLDPGVELLSKPYSRQQLAVKVRQVLGNNDDDAMEPGAVDARSGDGVVPGANGQGLRVLVVEDDAASLDATFELLTLIGMKPQRADSAAAALNALQAEDFDVLFTDVIMPDMSGTELARRAFATRPALRIVFASGNPVPAHEKFEFEWSALRKPFTLDQLRAALQPAMRPLAEPDAGDGQSESTDGPVGGAGSL
jgi:CheY-like chemotaxis protein